MASTAVRPMFFPLSLITRWYGMNFRNMPGLHYPYSYFILIGNTYPFFLSCRKKSLIIRLHSSPRTPDSISA
ncbi:hypothetical protein DW241_17180 [Hungatella hathewayi]|uniref:CorA family divalent cation transporter n=1 Tax=Anaerostipes faecis TaxID=2880702 RepID=UPI000ECC9BBF|nr:hypothetical protein DW241_17180 [Hungatella hathewayi]